MMHDQPSGTALLDAAREALSGEITPSLTGRARYVAAMIVNALGIVAREIDQGGEAARAWDEVLACVGPGGSREALVAAIRAGRHDADPELHAALVEAATVAAEIWKPRALTPADQKPAGLRAPSEDVGTTHG
ncbi:hypothetical protein QO001_005630 [Methylobacterium brachiatum]|uniref:DUF6285 domain-containing protein n=1 Tax=Methylobacterium brachiatum TaxID=269660 RepID=A0AAJ1U2A9_9HYPH|nr:DUF6285 domain-containing protein [Methylobacterium brachiatum]MCB4806427.1 DUF6285 domain-containing protein [Methylobacterium brachiatum]MDQ0546678.1 hypothetical protein [Methylobacterium brachiatum]